MENPHPLDQLLRDRVYDLETPAPEFVWTNVEAALQRKKRRFGFWFWLLAGLCTAGTAWWMAPGRQSATALEHTAAISSLQNTAVETQRSIPEANLPEAAATPAANNATVNADASEAKTILAPKRGLSAKALAHSDKSAPLAVLNNMADLQTMQVENAEPSAPNQAGPDFNAVPHLSIKPGLSLSLSPKTDKAPIPSIKKSKGPHNCYDFDYHQRVFLLDAYGGPMAPIRTLNVADNEALDYLNQRKNSERPTLGFNAGIRGSILLNRNVLVRTGVHYAQMIEIFEHSNPLFVETVITVRDEFINGSWQTVIDTNVQYGAQTQKIYNRMGLLDIPLSAGLEWRHGRTGISAQAGGSFNLLFWKRGAILNPQGEVNWFTPGDGAIDLYRARAGWSIQGSVQWFWHLRPDTRLFIEPEYRRIMQPLNLAQHAVEQRYDMLSLKLGVTKILN